MADKSKDAVKTDQEHMDRLAQEFSTLVDREEPEGSGSGNSANRKFLALL